MSGFSADWLALREPFDQRARNVAVLDAVAATFKDLRAIRIVDLACGTGSTLRALTGRLNPTQSWTFTDNDLSLLARAAGTPRAESVTVIGKPVDLARDLEAALDGPVDLVTTSALLDLVSQPWLERLTVEIAARRIPLYAALSYDGRVAFAPPDALDDRIVGAFNAHQRTDKGFGPALGPLAATEAIVRFEALGYTVTQGPSDWVAGPNDRDFQSEILTGWAGAARETGMAVSDTVNWLSCRRAALAEGRASLRVGHIDFFATPTGTR